jgi:hypothetical protein
MAAPRQDIGTPARTDRVHQWLDAVEVAMYGPRVIAFRSSRVS